MAEARGGRAAALQRALDEAREAQLEAEARLRAAREAGVERANEALEGAVGSTKADCRRLIAEQEGETQRQCDTLGRAIHSLADTLNLTSPLITIGSAPPPAFDGGMYEYSPGGYDGSSR